MTAPRSTPRRIVLGIGMSSNATAEEVRALVGMALHERLLGLDDVSVVATRERFVLDRRLDLGKPLTGFADELLIGASAPCGRTVGIPARVAETAALLAGGSGRAALIGDVERSAHVTVAVAVLRPAEIGP